MLKKYPYIADNAVEVAVCCGTDISVDDITNYCWY